MKSPHKITLTQARRVLKIVDAGLSNGLGKPVPGEMCVEAAVCFALGQPHGDEPACVARSVRAFKITLNDASGWTSNAERAKGMRKLAIAQLGTADGQIDEAKFVAEIALQTIRQIVPIALRCAASVQTDKAHRDSLEAAAKKCETAKDLSAAEYAAKSAKSAAKSAEYAAKSAAKSAEYAAKSAAEYAEYAAESAEYAAKYAEYAAESAEYAAKSAKYAAKYAEYAAEYAEYAKPNAMLNILAEIGVQALRTVGAAGIKLMDQLIS